MIGAYLTAPNRFVVIDSDGFTYRRCESVQVVSAS